MCPVSVRRQDQSGAMGNLVSMVVAPLYVGIADGAERLSAQRAAMEELKRRDQAAGIYELIASTTWWPAPLWRLVWQLWPRRYFPFHLTSTNVPGPRRPLFLGEHELLHWYPFGVQWTNNGLFLCTLSYREYLTLGPVAEWAPIPEPGPGEVLIRTTAANVSFVDRLIVRGGYQVKPPLPFTPGAVGAGEVVDVGDGITHLTMGTSVIVLKSGYGTWATHVVAPAWAPIPSNVADEVAVAAIEASGTASYALEDRGGLRAGERVLVLGASGAVGAARWRSPSILTPRS